MEITLKGKKIPWKWYFKRLRSFAGANQYSSAEVNGLKILITVPSPSYLRTIIIKNSTECALNNISQTLFLNVYRLPPTLSSSPFFLPSNIPHCWLVFDEQLQTRYKTHVDNQTHNSKAVSETASLNGCELPSLFYS